MLRVSVIIASYRRLDALARCLDGVRRQARTPEEVLVIVHPSDAETAAYAAEVEQAWPAVRCVTSPQDGSVAAYNAGLAAARHEIVAYVDDDAVPNPNWTEQIVRTFEQDGRIAAVGGRDIIFVDGRRLEGSPTRLRRRTGGPPVGRIQWFGRMIANHHLGIGPPRDVDVLKGVNMSFRRDAVVAHGFDARLRGNGAQVHSELSICLPLRRRGLRIVYDPEIVVLHYPAARPAGDHRVDFEAERVSAAAHNEALQILDYLRPLQRPGFAVWGTLVGSTDAPGLVAALRDLARRRPVALPRSMAAQRGRVAAWHTWRRDRRPTVAEVFQMDTLSGI